MQGLRMSWGAALVLACGILAGCNSDGPSRDELIMRTQQLRERLDEAERALQAAPNAAQYQAMQQELAQREARIRELEKQLRTPEGGGTDPGLSGIETTYDRKRGELTVNLPADILFASGKADLKATSRATLDKVVVALRKEYPGKKIRVEGHTDRDPIARSGWRDNLELSLQRSAAVTRYLIAKGIDRRQIMAAGHGDVKPKATKAASRRVEIIVVVG